MALRIDYTTITFTTNDSPNGLHLGCHVHLAHSSSSIRAAMFLGHIAKCTRRRQIRNGIPLCVRQHIVGHADERIFLTKHRAVLADESQTVDIGVDNDTQIILAGLHLVHDALQILLQRLGIVGEVASRLGVENRVFHAQLVEQLGQNDTTNGVDGVHTNAEMRVADGLSINQFEAHHIVNVPLVGLIAIDVMAQVVNIGILEVLLLGNLQHLSTVLRGEELALAVQQLQRIPLARIMRSRDDDAAVSAKRLHGKLRRGRSGEPDVHDIVAHTHDGSAHHIVDHNARDASITPDNDGRPVLVEIGILPVAAVPTDESGVSSCEFHYVERIERVARPSAYRSANT